MIREIVSDQFRLSQKSLPATKEDLPVVQDLLDTIIAHATGCVGMAANMIGINNETLDNYKKKLALKAMHYRYLSSSFTEFEELAKKYSKEKNLTDIQVSTLLQNNKITYPLWWENIKI